MRKRLIDELREKGIEDERVLQAFDDIPRHWFLDKAFLEIAYENRAFQIGCGQTISHPYTVAFQSQLLDIQKGDKVLEIGTGSGFQSCILELLGAKVFSIERQRDLYVKTKAFLKSLRYKVNCFYGDGYKGLPSFAPFDKVIVTAGAPYIPPMLIEQLKIGGIMVIPVGQGDQQDMKILLKTGENEHEITSFGDFSFVPLLQNKEWGGKDS